MFSVCGHRQDIYAAVIVIMAVDESGTNVDISRLVSKLLVGNVRVQLFTPDLMGVGSL